MIYDKPPFAIATTAKTGITKPKDLEGKVLGAPAADGAFAQWKAFVKENEIDDSKVKIENDRLPGARADARRRQGRRHHRLLVLDALQPAAEGPQAARTSRPC